MRTWSRKNSLSGVKIRSDMDAREAAVLRSLVGSVIGLLRDRAADVPTDELAAMTGLRTGHSTPPEDAALARLLPDFHRRDQSEDGSDTAGYTNRTSSTRSCMPAASSSTRFRPPAEKSS